MRALFRAVCALPILARYGRYLSDSKNPAIAPQAIAAGTKLFMGWCAGCHAPGSGGGRLLGSEGGLLELPTDSR